MAVLSPLSEATLRTTTGIVPKPPLMTRAEAFAGKVAFTESKALLRESVTFAVLVPKSNVTRTVEIEDWLVEEVVVTPSRLSTAPSITRDTCESMTSGDAPGYEVTIAACGNSNEGKSSCLSWPTATNPKTASIAVIRATTDLLAKDTLERRNM